MEVPKAEGCSAPWLGWVTGPIHERRGQFTGSMTASEEPTLPRGSWQCIAMTCKHHRQVWGNSAIHGTTVPHAYSSYFKILLVVKSVWKIKVILRIAPLSVYVGGSFLTLLRVETGSERPMLWCQVQMGSRPNCCRGRLIPKRHMLCFHNCPVTRTHAVLPRSSSETRSMNMGVVMQPKQFANQEVLMAP